MNKQKDEF